MPPIPPMLTARELRKAATKNGATPPAAVQTVQTSPLWTMEDVAVYLQTSYGAVRNMRMRGLLPPAIKRGRTVRWAPETIIRWTETFTEAASTEAAATEVAA